MKKIAFLFLVVLCLGAYSYYGVFLKESEKAKKQAPVSLIEVKSELLSIKLTHLESEIHLELEEGIWWVVHPHKYIADQEFIFKSIEVMRQTPVMESFPLEEDHFGLTPGKALFEMASPMVSTKDLLLVPSRLPKVIFIF